MGAEPTRQLPYPFHGVQFRTVGWQELEPEQTAMFPQPRLEKPGMVPAGIVQNEDQHTAFSTVAQELFQRGASWRPAKPLRSKRRTQYWTVLGLCPKSSATSLQLLPEYTSRIPWRRWSYRESSDRSISC